MNIQNIREEILILYELNKKGSVRVNDDVDIKTKYTYLINSTKQHSRKIALTFGRSLGKKRPSKSIGLTSVRQEIIIIEELIEQYFLSVQKGTNTEKRMTKGNNNSFYQLSQNLKLESL